MAYAFQAFKPETMARAMRKDAGISFKAGVMLAQKLRGMQSDKAIRFLGQVQKQKAAVPYTRFRDGAGHKPGMGSGKFPVKASAAFQQVLEQAIANAENKGLGTPLKIIHVMTQQASCPVKPGRQRSRQMKRAHIELVLAETEESQKSPKKVKAAKKETKVAATAVKKAAEPKAAATPARSPEAKPKEGTENPKENAPKKSTEKPKEDVKDGN